LKAAKPSPLDLPGSSGPRPNNAPEGLPATRPCIATLALAQRPSTVGAGRRPSSLGASH
ncbi:hypothetical protein PanWU01x14_259600, partial [Parasponia andersonii]